MFPGDGFEDIDFDWFENDPDVLEAEIVKRTGALLTDQQKNQLVMQSQRVDQTRFETFSNFLFSGTGGLFAYYPETRGPIGVDSNAVRTYLRQMQSTLVRFDVPDSIYWVDELGGKHRPSVIGEEVAFGFGDVVFKAKTLKDADRDTASDEKLATDALYRHFKATYPDLWNQWVEMTFEWYVPDPAKPAEGYLRQTGLQPWSTTYTFRNKYYKALRMNDFQNNRYGREGQNVKVGIVDIWLEWWLRMQNVLWNAEKTAKELRDAGNNEEASRVLNEARLAVFNRCRRFSRNDVIGWIEVSKFWELWRLFAGNRPTENKARAFQEGMKGLWPGEVIAESQFQPSVDAIEFEKWVRKFRLAHDPETWAGMSWKEATEKMNYTGLTVASKWTWVRWAYYAQAFAGGYSPDIKDDVTGTEPDESSPFGANPVRQYQTGPFWHIARKIYLDRRNEEEAARGEWVEGWKPADVPPLGSRARDQLIQENWGRSQFLVWAEKWANETVEHELFEPARIGMKVGPSHEEVSKEWEKGAWKYQQKQQVWACILAPNKLEYENILLDENRPEIVLENPTLLRLIEEVDLKAICFDNAQILAELRHVCGAQNVAVIYGYNGGETGLAHAFQMADAALMTRMALETEIADMRGWKGPGDAIKYFAAFAQPPCQHGYNSSGKVNKAKGHGSAQDINIAPCTNYPAGSHMCYGHIVGEWGSRGIKGEPDNWMWADPDGDKHPMKFFGQYCQVMPPAAHQVLYRMLRIGELFHVMYRAPHTDGIKWELRARVWGLLRIGSLEDVIEVIKGLLKGRPMDRSFRTVQRGMTLTLPKWGKGSDVGGEDFVEGKKVSITEDSRYPSRSTVMQAHEFDERVEHAWAVEFWKVAKQMYPWLKVVYKERGVDFDPETFCRIVEWATDLADYQVTDGSLYPL